MAAFQPLRLGSTVPDFAIDSTMGRIESFHDFIGDQWCLLCSHVSVTLLITCSFDM